MQKVIQAFLTFNSVSLSSRTHTHILHWREVLILVILAEVGRFRIVASSRYIQFGDNGFQAENRWFVCLFAPGGQFCWLQRCYGWHNCIAPDDYCYLVGCQQLVLRWCNWHQHLSLDCWILNWNSCLDFTSTPGKMSTLVSRHGKGLTWTWSCQMNSESAY